MSKLAIDVLCLAGAVEIASGIGEFVRIGEMMKPPCGYPICTFKDNYTKRIRCQDGIGYIAIGCTLIGLSLYCSSLRRSRLLQQKKNKHVGAAQIPPTATPIPI